MKGDVLRSERVIAFFGTLVGGFPSSPSSGRP